MAQRMRESYVWTDSEVDFLLDNTLHLTKAACLVMPLVLCGRRMDVHFPGHRRSLGRKDKTSRTLALFCCCLSDNVAHKRRHQTKRMTQKTLLSCAHGNRVLRGLKTCLHVDEWPNGTEGAMQVGQKHSGHFYSIHLRLIFIFSTLSNQLLPFRATTP